MLQRYEVQAPPAPQRHKIAWTMNEPVQDIIEQIAVLRRMLTSEKSLEQQGAWTETTVARP
eukprot:931804-Pyramimonas_sp.AAC.1